MPHNTTSVGTTVPCVMFFALSVEAAKELKKCRSLVEANCSTVIGPFQQARESHHRDKPSKPFPQLLEKFFTAVHYINSPFFTSRQYSLSH